MTLWFAVALMTVAAIFAVLWPLARPAGRFRSGSDVEVYRDQLDEIERDRAAGLIADKEAAAAQVEVSRRLIAAADAQTPAGVPAASAAWRRRMVAIAALVALPLLGLGSSLFTPQHELWQHLADTQLADIFACIFDSLTPEQRASYMSESVSQKAA